MGARRAEVRPRYGRLAAAVSSLGVTAVAVLGGVGLLPSAAEETAGAQPAIMPAGARVQLPAATERRSDGGGSTVESPGSTPGERVVTSELLPAGSGEGRRVVFSEGRQRVWIVTADGQVLRTYLVSGSLHDNLDPGTYEVYSRSLDAVGIDDSGTMRYFVRFTQGDSGAAIGFHDIPVDDGERVQTAAELGTPTSHGCIRQRTRDAELMWDFARLGTTVVVVA
ncbi:L,D-transpeptidase [Nocardioides euryhalodurans]|uniref:Murein L,D-transpeptidase n=1 Tax=Nocardioides euryhalodurans TaxID=2518370 RepID=A0A4V1BDQ4_9ACTN|nr:L,D-transpeptidase [Nocardioides euryhalodurans]QBR91932.1 murein L,D-transpeptidase [Nocardioides euryhalodurans]